MAGTTRPRGPDVGTVANRIWRDRMPLKRSQIAWRAAQDLTDGAYVNLGIGLPTLVADFIPADREIVLHSENGILGVAPAPSPNAAPSDLLHPPHHPIPL